MNPAVFASLPSSACTLGTAGTGVNDFGTDRIVQNSYDANGRVTLVKTAFGTADQANEVASAYTANGQISHVIDAENNRTGYIYDGHGRLSQTRYPMPTKGANTASTTDYEQLSYDANSNVTIRRLRDATSIALTYDNLNRATLKDLPGTDPDVTYTYDLLGRPLSAATATVTNSFLYDALSRMTREIGQQGQVNYQYDIAGRRTRITYPGTTSLFVDTVYDVTGNVLQLRENGATSGAGVLATYAYDTLGRRQSVTFGNGTSRSFSFDASQRLSSLTNNPAGTVNDQTVSFGYNPASQIASLTKSGDNYAWNGHYNINRNYTANGLNQLTAAGATTLGYDGRGNLTSSGTSAYTYSSENQLRTGPNGAALDYDPLGRLQKISATGAPAVTRFQYDGQDLIAEYAGTTLTKRYVHGPGVDEPIVWYEGSGLTDKRYLMSDERGSVVNITDASGATLNINTYDEYGIPAATNIGRFGYTGQTWLAELGMNYYKARIYSPTLGRFMQSDPIGYGDGMNMYNYVGGDPVNGVDPSGLSIAPPDDDGDLRRPRSQCMFGIYCDPNEPNPLLDGEGGDGGGIVVTGSRRSSSGGSLGGGGLNSGSTDPYAERFRDDWMTQPIMVLGAVGFRGNSLGGGSAGRGTGLNIANNDRIVETMDDAIVVEALRRRLVRGNFGVSNTRSICSAGVGASAAVVIPEAIKAAITITRGASLAALIGEMALVAGGSGIIITVAVVGGGLYLYDRYSGGVISKGLRKHLNLC